MKHFAKILAALGIAVASAQEPLVPPWSEEEWTALQAGELLPGDILLYLRTDAESGRWDELMDLPQPELPTEDIVVEPLPEPVIDPLSIEEADLVRYFSGRPEKFLSDVQQLLSEQQLRDREAFLEYHAGDSQIPIYIFVFRAEQEVPMEFPVQAQLLKQLYDEDDAVLVYYHLGAPERSQLAVSNDLQARVSPGDWRRALASSVAEAREKSEEVDQLENFAVQLSIRLYWIERNLREGNVSAEARSPETPVEEEPSATGIEAKVVPFWQRVKEPVLIGLGLVATALLGWLGRWFALRRRQYHFPEADFAGRLGAPHAAGVGAVITFRSRRLPPSEQKEEESDYLERY